MKPTAPFSSRNLTFLGMSFAFIFLGFAGVQQYVTSFFTERGAYRLGILSLILIYTFLALSSPFAARTVQRYGPKKVMLFSSLFYGLYCASLLLISKKIIIFSSALLGIAAAHLWTAQQSYLLRFSQEEKYGKNAGYFSSLHFIGPLLGTFLLGILIESTSFTTSFLIFSLFPLLGFGGLTFLQDLPPSSNPSLRVLPSFSSPHFLSLGKRYGNKTVIRLIVYWITVASVFGVVISLIPIEASEYFSRYQVGAFLSLFYAIPIIFSHRFGRISDNIGREKMMFIAYLVITSATISLFFSSFSVVFLVIGFVALSFSRAITAPINSALIGDISSDHNLEFLSALSLFSQQLGVVLGLFLATLPSNSITYTTLFAFIIFSFSVVSPLLKKKISFIKEELR